MTVVIKGIGGFLFVLLSDGRIHAITHRLWTYNHNYSTPVMSFSVLQMFLTYFYDSSGTTTASRSYLIPHSEVLYIPNDGSI